jgi:zinc D-Ala-D-Ala carboxypeptidase
MDGMRRTPTPLLVLTALALVGTSGCAPAGDPADRSSSTVVAGASRVAEPPGAPPGPLGVAGGALPGGVTVLDEGYPGVANLDPALLGALREAAADARDDGVEIVVNSGWRSAAFQQALLDEAVAEHGSRAEAARWVAAPEASAHVTGDAVDLGPAGATTWLAEHGARYGLCRVYRNEPWHHELRPDAAERGCPPLYDDPTDDPRTR